MIRSPRVNGWKADQPDPRDIPYSAIRPGSKLLKALVRPSKVDLRGTNFPPIFNQGQVGSCVGNGVARVCGFAEGKEGNGATVFSRLFIYFNARKADGTQYSDVGTTIRGGIKSIVSNGVCVETPYWPYIEANWPVTPSPEAYAEAEHRKTGYIYARLNGKSDILDCLANGYPVVFGATLFEQFETLTHLHNVVKMPKPDEAPIGGHCMVIVGYDTKKKLFLVANSWGAEWGNSGYCWFPFAYLLNTNLADDFWTVRQIAK